MSARETLNELSKLHSVQDALMRQLEDDLRAVRADREEIDRFLHKAIVIGAARTAMMVEAQSIYDEATKVCSLSAFKRPSLRLVQ